MKPMPVIKPSITFAMPSGGMHEQIFAGLHKSATRRGDQGKGPQSRASGSFFTIPANRHCESKGCRQGEKVSSDLQSIQVRAHW
jgi:hypothetical protein